MARTTSQDSLKTRSASRSNASSSVCADYCEGTKSQSFTAYSLEFVFWNSSGLDLLPWRR